MDEGRDVQNRRLINIMMFVAQRPHATSCIATFTSAPDFDSRKTHHLRKSGADRHTF